MMRDHILRTSELVVERCRRINMPLVKYPGEHDVHGGLPFPDEEKVPGGQRESARGKICSSVTVRVLVGL